MPIILKYSATAFLQQCAVSSQVAYDLLKSLVEEARTRDEQAALRRFLESVRCEIARMGLDTEASIERFHFGFHILHLDGYGAEAFRLTLLQLPSIFTPEDWSFTFYEGLARYPASEFHHKVIAELGCGNGWISIALAMRSQPAKMIGLDINPKAVMCARVNLILNAYDSAGILKVDREGRNLLECIEFHTSDLLRHIINNHILVDRIIGCIPQVLSPEPIITSQIIPEDSNDEFLYALSNYCGKQGQVEDQFGLGLIARALEESIAVVSPSAKIILNLGERPGSAVLERLFTRRGFSIRKLWRTKVWQAADTNILPLVEIERSTPHRFEFYTSLASDEPICARTAMAFSQHGGRIAHSLGVYEAQLHHLNHIRTIFKLIRQPEFADARSGLDLAFVNDDVADEKISFIGSIAEWLQDHPHLPYSQTDGEHQLRYLIAEYLRSYWHIPLIAANIFIAPNRASIIRNHFYLYKPALALVERELTMGFPHDWLTANLQDGHKQPIVLEVPKRIDEICKFIKQMSPNLVVTSMNDFETKTSAAFVYLVETCAQHATHLILDLSNQFELSSQPSTHGVLAHLAENPLPPHVSLLCGLVRNRVYSDLELCFLISENATQLEHLCAAAELTYSRTPLLSQRYYWRILADLLNFQLRECRRGKVETRRTPIKVTEPDSALHSPNVQLAFSHPALKATSLKALHPIIRMDYGENCLHSPPSVHGAIAEAFVRQNISSQEINTEKAILRFIEQRFGLSKYTEKSLILGSGVATLFTALAEYAGHQRGRMLFPTGAYGYFKATCDFLNVEVDIIATSVRHQFKITAAELDEHLRRRPATWLYLNAPVVNPTGALYTSTEVQALRQVLAQHQCGLIIDTIFSGLEFDPRHGIFDLRLTFGHQPPALAAGSAPHPLVVMGGLSKELAAGGLRFSWALTDDEAVLSAMRSNLICVPHSTVRYAARKIYAALSDPQNSIYEALAYQRKTLQSRCLELSAHLSSLGWDVIDCEGGLFVCASPRKYLQKAADNFHGNIQKTVDAIAQNIFDVTGLLINNATWTGLDAYCRFVVSVEQQTFEKALAALSDFDAHECIG